MTAQHTEVLDSAYARDRAVMVSRHLRARGIEDPLLLAAMGAVPREAFVPEHLQEFSYEDSALPIEAGQTISQPYIVARMLELAEIKPGDKVLEVGAGSGYAAAVTSRMANKVFAIERHEELAKLAAARLKRLGYGNVEIICADGTKGLPEEAPFQAIIVSAGGPHVPEPLKQQLAIGGRLVIPIGPFGFQTLMRVRRTRKNSFEEEEFGAVAFVPLIGEEGWAEPERAQGSARSMREPSGFAAGLLLPEKRARTIQNRLSRLMAEAAEPFGDLHELCELVERFADRRVILLGEATHGTAEFYQARARITEMLVDRHGFNIVAVEADWPDAAVYDAYVRGLPRPGAAEIRLHPLSNLDVAQRPGGGLPRPVEGDQRHDRRSRSQGRLLWARYLQPGRLDRGGACIISTRSIRKPPGSRASVTAASSPGAPSRRATAAWRSPAATPCARSPSLMR